MDASESVGAELDQTQIVRYKTKVHTFFHHQSANAHNSALHESRGDAKSEVEHEVPLEDVSDGVVSWHRVGPAIELGTRITTVGVCHHANLVQTD